MHRVKEKMGFCQRECTGYVHTALATHKKSKYLCILSNNGPKGEAGMSGNDLIKPEEIQNKIYTIHDVQVMLDRDLAEFYGVETRVLNQAVKRNIERFPERFMFQLAEDETDDLMSQSVMSSSGHGGRRKLPYVFTEQGVAMLAGVLRSDTAVKMSIQIINAFVAMRRFIAANAQIFDAYKFVADLIRTAQKSIILIDNYIDDSVLTILTKRRKNVRVILLTKYISNQLAFDIKKFNEQYPAIEIKEFKNSHDRFIIIDNTTVYHFGASLKDLGKKWFAFSKMDFGAVEMLTRLKEMKVDE